MKAASSILITMLPTILFTTVCGSANGVELPIDLSPENEGLRVVRQLRLRGETTISLSLRRVDPDAKYDLLVRIDESEIPPIVVGGVAAMSRAGGSAEGSVLNLIESNADSSDDVRSAKEEEEGQDDSPTEVWTSVARRDSASTMRLADVATIRPGQMLEVVVRRQAGSGSSEAVWRYAFTTGSQGKWTVSLGFGLSVLLDGDREYFTRSDTSEFYTIMEEKSDDVIHPIPALFFHWVPRDDELAAWSWSLTAGLGYDFRNAVIFAGGSATFYRNITFAVGAVVHQVNRLNRRYRVGELLREDLDSEQLLEQRYAVNPFVAVSFRLSEKLLGD